MSTLFPLLPRRFRSAFRVGLLVLVALLAVFVALRWQPPLIGISALGLPLLFAAYVRETDAFDDLSRATLAVTSFMGVAAGIAWAFAADAIWARTYDDVLGTPMSPAQELVNLVLVPTVGVLMMLLPVAVVRFWRPGAREPLHGFAIGAVAALSFTAAGIVTRGAPEFANGLVVKDFPMDALIALATIRGVAAPLTAVAVGGMVGATWWFRPRIATGQGRHWYSPTSPVPAIVVALLLYLGQNAIDFAWISYAQIVGLYAAIAMLALLALRVALHGSMPGERTAEAVAAQPPSVARPMLWVASALAVVVATTIGLSLWLTPPPANYACPPDCGRPPLGQPVTTNPRFTPSDGAFTVAYPGPGTAYDATLENNGVYLELHAGDGGSLQLFGEPAANRTPRQIAEDLIREAVPEAETDYEIPNAMVGYQLGYGVVADVFKAGSAGDTARLRVLVMVAVKNDYALIAAAAGPYREFTPDFGSGHPSGANFFLALDIGKYVNSFSWRGDPPR